MYDSIKVRFGDSTLKGKNRHRFIDRLVGLIQEKVDLPNVGYEREMNSLIIHANGCDLFTICERLQTVSGISSYSPIVSCEKTLESIKATAVTLYTHTMQIPKTFKIETIRSDKAFPITSMEVSRKVGGYLLDTLEDLSVDVHRPKTLITVEIRHQSCFLYTEKIPGLGGFPAGIAGKGYLLLSGGIDSPVAGFLSMRQGIEIEALHFESSPLTSLESVQKVVDTLKILSKYAQHNTMKLHLFPFRILHEAILANVPEAYHIIIMRRMMLRLCRQFAARSHTPVLITGESVGQVASQTLDSLHTVNAVTTIPILRPLITMDKNAIIDIAKKIGTYDVSIRPFEDCCTVYVPKKPTTSPRESYALKYERLFDYKKTIDTILADVTTLTITSKSTLDLTQHGYTLKMALETLKGEE